MGAINRKGCTCASCRSPAVVARLALDEADRLEQALRRKYRTPADALSALGLDESVLDEEGERTMPKLSYDARSRDMMRRGDQEEEEMSGYDRRRGRDMRSRDQEMEPGEEREDDLEELIRELSGEDRRMVTDAVRSLLANRDTVFDRRRGARDQPPPFAGMPMPGGGMVGGSTSWSDKAADWSRREAQDRWHQREAEDRKRSRFAHDMAVASGQGFYDFFPDALRIRTTGF